MDYLFIYDGKSWWLKLTDTEQIIDYHRQTSGRYEGAISLYMKIKQEGKSLYDFMDGLPHKERIELMESRDYKYLHCALIKAEKSGGTLFDGFRGLNMETGMAELETVKRYGAVFINPAGGHTHGIKTVQFCRRKQMIFPTFCRSDIRAEQFKGGKHWYAYIGDMQVRNGDIMKWNTEEEARRAAEELVMEKHSLPVE